MKKIIKVVALIFAFISSITVANAFGYFRKDNMLDFMGVPYFGFFAGFGLLVLIALLFLFVFWLLMLVDCLKRDFKKDIEKIAWILVLIFLHLLGAVIYYFVVKIGKKEITTKSKK